MFVWAFKPNIIRTLGSTISPTTAQTMKLEPTKLIHILYAKKKTYREAGEPLRLCSALRNTESHCPPSHLSSEERQSEVMEQTKTKQH